MPALLNCLLALSLLIAAASASTPGDDGNKACPDIFQETAEPESTLAGSLALLGKGKHEFERLNADYLEALATPLAVPRPVGSPGHRRVRDHLADAMRSLGWHVELDTFQAETPAGRQRFDNIVATLPSPESGTGQPRRRLVLAAHYDSKRLLGDAFVGATDSAVPCAILLLIAETLQRRLRGSGVGSSSPGAIVQVVFFDGEEAFEQWTRSDSLYGSRHLAGRWAAEEGANPGCPLAREVEALVLLDLIGGRDPRFYFNPRPGLADRLVAKEMSLFKELVAVETAIRLIGSGSSSSRSLSSQRRYFQWPQLNSELVQDDQAPFQEVGVPTVHLLPLPFPSVWHTADDTLDRIQWDQAADVATIVFVWLAQKIGI